MILIELGTYRYGKSIGFGAPILVPLETRGSDRGLEAGHLSHAGASRVFAAPVWAYLLGLPGRPDFAPSSHLPVVEETQQRAWSGTARWGNGVARFKFATYNVIVRPTWVEQIWARATRFQALV